MWRLVSFRSSSFALLLLISIPNLGAQDQPIKVQIHWDHVVRIVQTKPTILLGSSPAMLRRAPLHDQIFQRVKDLGADDVRYTGAGYDYPHGGIHAKPN